MDNKEAVIEYVKENANKIFVDDAQKSFIENLVNEFVDQCDDETFKKIQALIGDAEDEKRSDKQTFLK